jgi:hypothetical protein
MSPPRRLNAFAAIVWLISNVWPRSLFLSSSVHVEDLSFMIPGAFRSNSAAATNGVESHRLGGLSPRRFSLLLALVLGATFFPVLDGRKTFFHGDFAVFTYPLASYQHQCFWRGELPLWNPFNNLGIPLLAQWNTAMLYPPSLFYLLLPLPWSLGVFNVAHLVLAGVGMYYLARRWTGSLLGASLAGVAFAFNGLSWHFLMWVSNLAAYAWMPWVLLTLQPALRDGGRKIVLAALTGALQMFSGAPEIIVLTWGFAAAWAFLELFAQRRLRRSLVLRLGLVVLLVAGLAAAQVLPFLDFLRYSDRSNAFRDEDWVLPVAGLANFVTPLFRCYASHHGVTAQYGQGWTASYYPGIGIVLLAVVAVWKCRSRQVVLLAATAALGVWLALGPQGGLLRAIQAVIPQTAYMRYPIKFITITLFVLPLLAAYGARWLESGGKATAGVVRALSLVVIGMLVFIGLILYWAYADPVEIPSARESFTITLHNGLERMALLILFGAGLVMNSRTNRPRAGLVLGVGLLLLQWLDVFTHAPQLSPFVETSVYQPNLARPQFGLDPVAHVGEPRVLLSKTVWEKLYFNSLAGARDDCLFRRSALTENCNLLDGISKVDGFSSLFLAESETVLGLVQIARAAGFEITGALDFLGVARVGVDVNGATNGLVWERRPTFAPLVCAGQRPEFLSPTNTLIQFFRRPNYDPRQTVFLPLDAEGAISATNRVTARVIPGEYSPQRLEFEVDTPAPALVTVAQSFYHSWQAYVDGRRTRLWKANYAFQALEVPAGKHPVQLVYRDSVFYCGAGISALSLLTLCRLWVRPVLR